MQLMIRKGSSDFFPQYILYERNFRLKKERLRLQFIGKISDTQGMTIRYKGCIGKNIHLLQGENKITCHVNQTIRLSKRLKRRFKQYFVHVLKGDSFQEDRRRKL